MRSGVGSSFQSTEFLFVYFESVSRCVPGWVRTRLLQTQQRAACFCLSVQGLKVCDPLPRKKFFFLICGTPHKSLLELESDFSQWTLGLCSLKQQKKHLYYLEEKFSRERDLAGSHATSLKGDLRSCDLSYLMEAPFFFWGGGFKTRFLSVSCLAVLELAL